jgi:hypothetical protein
VLLFWANGHKPVGSESMYVSLRPFCTHFNSKSDVFSTFTAPIVVIPSLRGRQHSTGNVKSDVKYADGVSQMLPSQILGH